MDASMFRLGATITVAVFVDFSLFYAGGCVEPVSVSWHVARLWVTSVARCLTLWVLLLVSRGNRPSVLRRFALTHGVLPALFETGTIALWNTSSRCASWADAHCWLLSAGASLAAAFFWEATIPDSSDGGQEGKQKRRVLFTRVLGLFRPDYLLLFGGFIFLSLAVICQMFIPFYTGRVIDILRGEEKQSDFFVALIFMGLFSLGSSASAGCRGGILMTAITSFSCRIKVKLFKALTIQEVGFFEITKTGEITSRLSKDTGLMGRTVCLNVNVLLRTFIKTIFMIILMMNLSWKLTFLVLMETPVTSLVQSVYDKHYQRLNLALQDSMAVSNEVVNEVISGVRVVRSFNGHEHEHQRYNRHLMKMHNLKTSRDTVRALYLLVRRLTGFGMQVLMLYYGRLFIQKQQMTTGSLVSFILYQGDLGDNIRTLTYIYGDMLNSVGAARKVFEYLDREPKISIDGKLVPEKVAGLVRFDKLSFSYPTSPDKTVLHDFSLELKPGKMTALVGPSGHGKSTCASLMERLYEPQEGEIYLDDQPLKSYEHTFLHKTVAVVSQQPVLFSGTIRDNIAYGLPGCSMLDVQKAASKAAAHDFIVGLEKGYDTEVGQGGGRLSQSERQLIAIARALVRQPKVLILDEITSSLDAESENTIQQALSSWSDQTLLVVAHRLKTIEKAHQILLIHEGRVQERGSHQELMDKKGNYFRLREKLFDD